MPLSTRVRALETAVVADLEATVVELFDRFSETASRDDWQAYIEVSQWLTGETHGARPRPATLLKAFRFREGMPHDLI